MTQASNSSELSGVLVIDKPNGITSMDVVSAVRRRCHGARTGHAGTLDPLATGVLVVAIGKATKLVDRLMATDKQYLTSIDLTAFTTTDDRQGERTEIEVQRFPDESAIRECLRQFTGEFLQKPPAFSAVKVNGKRAYKLARKGQAVEIKPRLVRVHSISVARFQWPVVDLAIHCDKGFYVRSLARDLGMALGAGGHCASIHRTAVGPFAIDEAVSLDQLPAEITQEFLIANDEALEMVKRAGSFAPTKSGSA